jgi:hypothetical protein
MKKTLFAICIVALIAVTAHAGDNELELEGISAQATYPYTDTGWPETYSSTSDCVEGWGDDDWEFTNSAFGFLTVTVRDCCIIGDYYEIWVDGVLIGTTPDPGYPGGTTMSVGSATVWLAPGTHTVEIRDALDFIAYPTMCPAGYYVTGEWEAIVEFTKELTDEVEAPTGYTAGGDGDGILETGEDWLFEMTITLTNISGEAITGINMHDRLGGDLEWHQYVSTGFGLAETKYKGKTNKVMFNWYNEITLDPGETATIVIQVSPDVNTGTGNGKKSGHQEYTSAGEHCLNSGAWFEGYIDDIYIEGGTNPVCVDVVEAD